jgi:hypothetical protein
MVKVNNNYTTITKALKQKAHDIQPENRNKKKGLFNAEVMTESSVKAPLNQLGRWLSYLIQCFSKFIPSFNTQTKVEKEAEITQMAFNIFRKIPSYSEMKSSVNKPENYIDLHINFEHNYIIRQEGLEIVAYHFYVKPKENDGEGKMYLTCQNSLLTLDNEAKYNYFMDDLKSEVITNNIYFDQYIIPQLANALASVSKGLFWKLEVFNPTDKTSYLALARTEKKLLKILASQADFLPFSNTLNFIAEEEFNKINLQNFKELLRSKAFQTTANKHYLLYEMEEIATTFTETKSEEFSLYKTEKEKQELTNKDKTIEDAKLKLDFFFSHQDNRYIIDKLKSFALHHIVIQDKLNAWLDKIDITRISQQEKEAYQRIRSNINTLFYQLYRETALVREITQANKFNSSVDERSALDSSLKTSLVIKPVKRELKQKNKGRNKRFFEAPNGAYYVKTYSNKAADEEYNKEQLIAEYIKTQYDLELTQICSFQQRIGSTKYAQVDGPGKGSPVDFLNQIEIIPQKKYYAIKLCCLLLDNLIILLRNDMCHGDLHLNNMKVVSQNGKLQLKFFDWGHAQTSKGHTVYSKNDLQDIQYILSRGNNVLKFLTMISHLTTPDKLDKHFPIEKILLNGGFDEAFIEKVYAQLNKIYHQVEQAVGCSKSKEEVQVAFQEAILYFENKVWGELAALLSTQ